MYVIILQIIGIGLTVSGLLLALDQYFSSTFVKEHSIISTKASNVIEKIKGDIDKIKAREKESEQKIDSDRIEFLPNLYAEAEQIDSIKWRDYTNFLDPITNIKLNTVFYFLLVFSSILYWLLIFGSSAEQSLANYKYNSVIVDIHRIIKTDDLFLISWITLFVHLTAVFIHFIRVRCAFTRLEDRSDAFFDAAEEAEALLAFAAASPKSPSARTNS